MPDTTPAPVAQPSGIAHVRLTVTDVRRSKAFYAQLLGAEPALDFTDDADDPAAQQDRARFYGGCVFAVGQQLVGLRPGAPAGDRFSPTRVGLDHLSLAVGSRDDLVAAAERLTAAGVEHGEVTELADGGMVILSLQDPDDVNLELSAPLEG